MSKQQKTLFFIDDDEVYIYFMERVCRKIESVSNVWSASDGQDAIKKLEEWLETGHPMPDIMFVDINMPRLNGFEFLEEFNRMKADQAALHPISPVVMLTSSNEARDREKAIDLGIDAYLVKPDDMQEARQTISSIIG